MGKSSVRASTRGPTRGDRPSPRTASTASVTSRASLCAGISGSSRSSRRSTPTSWVNISLGGWRGLEVLLGRRPDAGKPYDARQVVHRFVRSRAACRSSTPPAAPAPQPACSMASTSTGSLAGFQGQPGQLIIRAEDKQNFTSLAEEFREAAQHVRPRRSTRTTSSTAFLPAAPSTIDAGFEVAELTESLDYVTFQGYDLGWFVGPVGHKSSFRSSIPRKPIRSDRGSRSTRRYRRSPGYRGGAARVARHGCAVVRTRLDGRVGCVRRALPASERAGCRHPGGRRGGTTTSPGNADRAGLQTLLGRRGEGPVAVRWYDVLEAHQDHRSRSNRRPTTCATTTSVASCSGS